MTITLENKEIPVLLITGYLGSGKTTLLNRILTNRRGIKFAVIVNDIGEVNIDADLIEKGGVVGKTDDSLVALQNGCICCTLKMDLAAQIADLCRMGRFDYIAIEASGICEPAPIAQTICTVPQLVPQRPGDSIPVLDCIVTVVDALRMKSEFACGDALTREGIEEDDLERLVIEQVEFCNLVLLNKASEVNPEELGRVKSIIHALNPGAEIITCDYADVDLDTLVGTGRFDFDAVYKSAAWLEMMMHPEEHGDPELLEYGISTFVYDRRRPFDLDAFADFAANWPDGIIRTKGMTWFAQQPDTCFLLEQSGQHRSFIDNGPFVASFPEDEQTRMLEENPGIASRWDESCGDRQNMLVFIGKGMDRAAIESALDACLTDWEH